MIFQWGSEPPVPTSGTSLDDASFAILQVTVGETGTYSAPFINFYGTGETETETNTGRYMSFTTAE